MRILLLFFILLFPTNSPANNVAARDPQEPGRFVHSAQMAFEYDDNVFKTFRSGENDGLIRMLLTSKRRFTFDNASALHAMAQIGGKKYFTLPEQDTLIGHIDLGFKLPLGKKTLVTLNAAVKGQIENNGQDPVLADINEDFVSHSSQFRLRYPLFFDLSQSFYSQFSYFSFFGELTIDFIEERFGTLVERPIVGPLNAKVGYEFSLTQFPNYSPDSRDDYQHQISGGLSYYGPFLVALSYFYEDNTSSQDAFSSTGHKVRLLLSLAFFSSQRARNYGEEDVTIHLLGTLQIRQYPAVFISDDEGPRLLFSNAEDNNFNALTVKLTKRLNRTLTMEFKFSRHSNELSDREDPFARNRFMLGLRASF